MNFLELNNYIVIKDTDHGDRNGEGDMGERYGYFFLPFILFNSLHAGYSKTCLKRPLKKKTKIGFQDRLLLNAGQKYCRMLHGEHSAILSTFIKLPFAIKIFVLSILSDRLRQVLL